MKNDDQEKVATASKHLDRMQNALANNALSDTTIQSHGGKTALAALLASAASGEFDADEARTTIKSTLRLG